MNVLIACYADVRCEGGGATFARLAGQGLQQRGHLVRLLSKSADPRQTGRESVNGLDTTFYMVGAGRFWRVPMLVIQKRLAAMLKKLAERPDVFIAASPFLVNAAQLAWPGVRVVFLFPCLLWRCLPLAQTSSPTFWFRMNHSLVGRAERRALDRAAAIVVQNECVIRDILDFHPVPRERFAVVPTGVDDLVRQVRVPRDKIREELETPADAVVALAAGHLDPNKNLSAVLEAVAAVRSESLIVWIAGDGPAREELQRQADRLGVTDRVRFLGWREDMPSLYAAADLLVHAARYDTFPNVYLEAMVSGLPVIGPRMDFPRVVSPLDSIITAGREGIAYDLNDLRSLTSCLDELAADSRMRQNMGRAARELAEREYTRDRYVSGIEETLS